MDHVSVVAVRLIHLCTSSWCTVEIIFLTFLSFLVSFYLFLSFLLVFFVVLVFFLSFVCFLFTYFGLCCFFLLSIYCCYFFICCCLISRTSGHQYLSVLQAPVSWSAPSYFFCRFAGQWEGIFVFIFFFLPPPPPTTPLPTLPLAPPCFPSLSLAVYFLWEIVLSGCISFESPNNQFTRFLATSVL